MSKIRIRNGPYAGRETTLSSDPVTIGRDSDADIQILDRSASRFHSEVFPVGGMYFVRDLGSKNGTFINEDRLRDEELLREGDTIKIGSTELVYESGVALSDSSLDANVTYDDQVELTNTIEFRLDDLSDIHDDEGVEKEEGRSLRLLYQFGKCLSGAAGRGLTPVTEALDLLVTALPADLAICFLKDRDSSKLLPVVVRTANKYVKPLIARSIVRQVMGEAHAVITDNAQEDARFNRKNSIVENDIRSVLCVPMMIEGSVRGVLYLTRGNIQAPFQQGHLEVISSCAVQIGLYIHGQEQRDDQQRQLWSTVRGLVGAMEIHSNRSGEGERCTQVALGLAKALKVSAETRWRVRLASLLHHIDDLCKTEDGRGTEVIGKASGFRRIVTIVRAARGNEGILENAEQESAARIVAIASEFVRKVQVGVGPDQAAEEILSNSGVDHVIAKVLVDLVETGGTETDLEDWGHLFEAAVPAVAVNKISAPQEE
jgi:pSer/pThr/pTyr-binding forkhead associated (FHA) protein